MGAVPIHRLRLPCASPPQDPLPHHPLLEQDSLGGEPRLFFECGHHRRGTHPQHAGGIADTASIECHLYPLPLDLRHSPFVMVLQEKDHPLAVRILAPISLFAIGLPSVFHTLTTSSQLPHSDIALRQPPQLLLIQGMRYKSYSIPTQLFWDTTANHLSPLDKPSPEVVNALPHDLEISPEYPCWYVDVSLLCGPIHQLRPSSTSDWASQSQVYVQFE
jgi:hypothetical protein